MRRGHSCLIAAAVVILEQWLNYWLASSVVYVGVYLNAPFPAIRQPTRPTQPSISPGSVNE